MLKSEMSVEINTATSIFAGQTFSKAAMVTVFPASGTIESIKNMIYKFLSKNPKNLASRNINMHIKVGQIINLTKIEIETNLRSNPFSCMIFSIPIPTIIIPKIAKAPLVYPKTFENISGIVTPNLFRVIPSKNA